MAVYDLGAKGGHGAQLGAALGTGLQNLANMKLQGLQKQHDRLVLENDLEKMGLPRSLAGLNPASQQVYLKNELQKPYNIANEEFMRDIYEKMYGKLPDENGNQEIANEQAPNQQQAANPNLAELLGTPSQRYSQGMAAGPMEALRLGRNEKPQLNIAPRPEVQQKPQQQIAPNAPQEQKKPLKGMTDKQVAMGLKAMEADQIRKQREATHARDLEEKKQTRIDRTNKPFIDEARKETPYAKELVDLIQDRSHILYNPKVKRDALSLWAQGKKLSEMPRTLLNSETQDAINLLDQVVRLESLGQPGRKTNMAMELEKSAKSHLGLTNDTIKSNFASSLKKAKRKVATSEAIDQLISDNNNRQPEGLATLVHKSVNEQMKVPDISEIPEEYRKENATFDNKWILRNRNGQLKLEEL